MGFSLTEYADVAFQTPNEASHFFGYYDKSPLDEANERLLSHRAGFDGREITATDSAIVGYWELDEQSFVTVDETSAFNWQQGAMLQWRPASEGTEIIYNDQRDDSFVSVVADIKSGETRTLPYPVYAVHPSGEFALCVNFERLYHCRPGYRYHGVENYEWDQPMHEDDGIYRMDLATGESEQIVSTAEICKRDPKPVFELVDNWLEHLLWNPSGTRFAFFHRWDAEDAPHKTRLFTADPDGSSLYQFPDTGLYSHMGWRNDEEFTIWGQKPWVSQRAVDTVKQNPLLERIVRPVYRFVRDNLPVRGSEEVMPGQAFIDFRDRNDDFEVIGQHLLTENGHNTWRDDERWMLTDTYPDETGTQRLLLYDADRNRRFELGRFDSSYDQTTYRCDLHPRWGPYGKRIVIDTAHESRRQMMIIQPDWGRLSDE